MRDISMILCGAGGAAATFLLQRYGLSPVIAACLIGLAGAGVAAIASTPSLAAVIFAGAFVGMSALTLTSLTLIVIAGAGSGLLYILMTKFNIFSGYGGRLGSIAFISITIVIFITHYHSFIKR
jgi:hypothetical protein